MNFSQESSIVRAHSWRDPFSDEASRWLLTAQESFQVSPISDWDEVKGNTAYWEAKTPSKTGLLFYWWSFCYDLSFLSWSGGPGGRAGRRFFAHTSYYGVFALTIPKPFRKSTKARRKYLQYELSRLLERSKRVERALHAWLLA